MTKYQYNVMNSRENKELRKLWTKPKQYEEFLNHMGSQGWQLYSERDMSGAWTIIFIKEVE